MLFVTLFNARPGTAAESTRRRLEWMNPEGVKTIAEYWLPTTSPRVVMVAEAEDMATLMATHMAWDPYFEMQTFPAITAEEGMRNARTMMAQAGAAPAHATA